MLDNLVFCVNNSTKQYIYNTSCLNDCTYRTFWTAASRNFASRVTGSIFSVLNGSRSSGAVSNTSTFFTQEIPQLTSAKVKKLTVLLLQSPDLPVYETCATGKTILNLKNALTEKNILFECEDNPEMILFYMCFQNPASRECELVKSSINSANYIIPSKLLLLNIFLWILIFLIFD